MTDWPKDKEAMEAFRLIAMQIFPDSTSISRVPDSTSISRVNDLAVGLYGAWKKFKASEKENEK